MKSIQINIKELEKIEFQKDRKRRSYFNKNKILQAAKASVLRPLKRKEKSVIVFRSREHGTLRIAAKIISYTKDFLLIEKGKQIPISSILKIES